MYTYLLSKDILNRSVYTNYLNKIIEGSNGLNQKCLSPYDCKTKDLYYIEKIGTCID